MSEASPEEPEAPSRVSSLLKGLHRRPALHFLLIGAALLGLQRWRAEAPVVPAPTVVISAATVEQRIEDYRRQAGSLPSPEAEAALIDQAIEEELLYREALARGLDRGDRSIAWRLVQKMQFLNGDESGDPAELHREALRLGLDRDDLVVRRILVQKMRLLAKLPGSGPDPGEEEVQAFFERTREQYRQPARLTLRHVFLSREKRGERLEADAVALLGELDASDPEQSAARGDPFPAGHRFRAQSARQLAKLFGSDFSNAVAGEPTGRWTGPHRSPYGLHLVWIEAREDERVPDLASVRSQVVERLRAQRGDEALADALRELRDRYVVQIEGRDKDEGADG